MSPDHLDEHIDHVECFGQRVSGISGISGNMSKQMSNCLPNTHNLFSNQQFANEQFQNNQVANPIYNNFFCQTTSSHSNSMSVHTCQKQRRVPPPIQIPTQDLKSNGGPKTPVNNTFKSMVSNTSMND